MTLPMLVITAARPTTECSAATVCGRSVGVIRFPMSNPGHDSQHHSRHSSPASQIETASYQGRNPLHSREHGKPTSNASHSRKAPKLYQRLRREPASQKRRQHTGSDAQHAEHVPHARRGLAREPRQRPDAEDRADEVPRLHEARSAGGGGGEEATAEDDSRNGVEPGVLGGVGGACTRSVSFSALLSVGLGRRVGRDSRLNMSSILFVITKPPEMLPKARSTDAAPKAWGSVCGRYPPPRMNMPPTPTMPARCQHSAQSNLQPTRNTPKGKQERTGNSIRHAHERRVQRRRNSPYNPVPNQASQRKRKRIPHQKRARKLAQRQHRRHTRGDDARLARRLLEGRQRHDLGLLLGLGLGGGRRRRGGAGRGREDLAVVGDDGAADDLVGEVDAELLFAGCHGEEELSDVVRVQGRGLGREARGEVRVACDC